MSGQGEVTELLRRWRDGESGSLDPLFGLVYPRLRQIASALFRGESAQSLLQPTSVVNELYLKLIQQRKLEFDNREHFYSLAAAMMRRILVDHARAERAAKRDGGTRVPLADGIGWITSIPDADLLDVDQALRELQELDPRKVQMVELRFFLGSTAEETAEVLNLSKATVDRDLGFARSWLHERLRSGHAGPGA